MVSCAGLSHGNERTLGYLRISAEESPLAVQIFGSDPVVMAEAARMVEDAGADVVDINFGCPVRKVTKTGAGATLLEDPDRACRIVEAVAGAVSVPVTVKMRRGLEDGSTLRSIGHEHGRRAGSGAIGDRGLPGVTGDLAHRIHVGGQPGPQLFVGGAERARGRNASQASDAKRRGRRGRRGRLFDCRGGSLFRCR